MMTITVPRTLLGIGAIGCVACSSPSAPPVDPRTSGRTTIVAINRGTVPLSVRFDISRIPDHRSFSAVRSSEREGLPSLPAPVPGGGGVVVTLPAEPATTLFQ